MPPFIRKHLPNALLYAGSGNLLVCLAIAAISVDNPVLAVVCVLLGLTSGGALLALSQLVTNSNAATAARANDSANIKAMTRSITSLVQSLEMATRDTE
jgi:hypothetical protein